jgi:hypothetical protein
LILIILSTYQADSEPSLSGHAIRFHFDQ